MLFSTLVYPMDSSEVIECEGKIVEIGLLLPNEVNPDQYVVTISNVEILRVFLHPEQFIPNHYVSIKYNSKVFILPCKYIIYIKEIK